MGPVLMEERAINQVHEGNKQKLKEMMRGLSPLLSRADLRPGEGRAV